MAALRRGNLDRLIHRLVTTGPGHRAELARATQVTRTTGSSLVNELLQRGVVVELPRTPGAHQGGHVDGRAGAAVQLSDRLWTAGIETTLDTISATVRTATGTTMGTTSTTVNPEDGWEVRRDAALRLLHELLADGTSADVRLLGLGIGVPGQVAPDGQVTGALADQPWSGVNVREVMEAATGVPVLVDNNVRMETFAESRWGAGRGCSNVLYAHAASGIAVGMVIDGELVRGHNGSAGEFGHLSIDVAGDQCACGNRGCLVLSAGRAAVMRSLERTWPEPPTWEQVLTLAAAGDRAAAGAFHQAGDRLGMALASLVNVVAPQLVIIGGDMARAGEVLRDSVARRLHELALSTHRDVPVVLSELGGGPAVGASGAAAMVWSDPRTDKRILDRLLS